MYIICSGLVSSCRKPLSSVIIIIIIIIVVVVVVVVESVINTTRKSLMTRGVICRETCSSVSDLRDLINYQSPCIAHCTLHTAQSDRVSLGQIRNVLTLHPLHASLSMFSLTDSKVDHCWSLLGSVSGHLLDILDSSSLTLLLDSDYLLT